MKSSYDLVHIMFITMTSDKHPIELIGIELIIVLSTQESYIIYIAI